MYRGLRHALQHRPSPSVSRLAPRRALRPRARSPPPPASSTTKERTRAAQKKGYRTPTSASAYRRARGLGPLGTRSAFRVRRVVVGACCTLQDDWGVFVCSKEVSVVPDNESALDPLRARYGETDSCRRLARTRLLSALPGTVSRLAVPSRRCPNPHGPCAHGPSSMGGLFRDHCVRHHPRCRFSPQAISFDPVQPGVRLPTCHVGMSSPVSSLLIRRSRGHPARHSRR